MAIITDDFRKLSAKQLRDDIANGTQYYIGIGKSDPWRDAEGDPAGDLSYGGATPAPQPANIDSHEVLENLAMLSKVSTTAAYPVIPRINLIAGNVYKTYDPADPTCFIASDNKQPCYAMNNRRELFICVRNANDGQTPAAMTTNEVTDLKLYDDADPYNNDIDSSESHGLLNPRGGHYVWAYLGKVDLNSGFYTNDYIAISDNSYLNDTGQSSDTPAETTGGMLLGFNVISGGSGYTSDPDVIVTCRHLDGTTTILTSDSDGINVARTNNTVSAVYFSAQTLIQNRTLNVVSASVHISGGGGSGAIVVVRVAPLAGFGAFNTQVLPTYYTGIKTQFPDRLLGTNDSADGIVGTEVSAYTYRQISLIKGPILLQQADGIDYADCLRYLVVSSTSGSLPDTGTIIWQGSDTSIAAALAAGAPVAYVDFFDANTNRLYYHQNIDTYQCPAQVNSAEFSATGTVKHGSGGANTLTYASLGVREYTPYTMTEASAAGYEAIKQNGQVLFIDNRAPISRSENQTEEIRLVIQF